MAGSPANLWALPLVGAGRVVGQVLDARAVIAPAFVAEVGADLGCALIPIAYLPPGAGPIEVAHLVECARFVYTRCTIYFAAL